MVSIIKLYNDANGIVSHNVGGNAEELTLPINQQFYKWWRSFAPNIPYRRDFDIVDHAKYAGHTFLIEVVAKKEYQFRLIGEEVKSIVGTNNSGKTLKFIKNPRSDEEKQQNELINHYSEIVENRCCRACSGNVKFAVASSMTFESIDCPLLNNDGQVSHIVGMVALNKN